MAVAEGNLSRIGTVFADDTYLYAAELDGGVTLIDLDTLEVAAQLGAVSYTHLARSTTSS